jgi:inner membrane protein
MVQEVGVATAFSHAAVALSLGTIFYKPGVPKTWLAVGAVCSALPDLDVIGFRFGIRYGDFWGHRGFTHSLVFAAFTAAAALFLGFSGGLPGLSRLSLGLYFFLATASHGLLDAMTDGGLGVAFFSPFDNHRYFLPWRPVHVAPIGVERFFTARGLAVMQSEFVWIWIPAVLLAVCVWLLRFRTLSIGR